MTPASLPREARGERVSFILHEQVSAQIARAWLEKWKFPRRLRERVVRLVELHLRGGDVENWKSLKPARKLLRDASDVIEDLVELIEADSRSSLGPTGEARVSHLPLLRKALSEASAIAEPREPALSGKRIMEFFAIKPGPEVKELKALAEEVREDLLLSGHDADEPTLLQKVAVLRSKRKDEP